MASFPGSRYGKGCQATCCSTLNSAVVAPIPMASESTAASAKPGVRPEAARGITQVEGQLFEPLPAPDAARVFHGESHAAEFLHHFGARPFAVFAVAVRGPASPCGCGCGSPHPIRDRDVCASTS